MSSDRREYVRYKPTAQINALFIWQNEQGGQRAPAQLSDLSQGGCSLISPDGPLVGTNALVVLSLPDNASPIKLQCRIMSRNPIGNARQTSMKFEEVSEQQVTHLGLAECEARAVMAGQLAATWSTLRADASPDEVSMASLLSETGELLLWHYAPDLPQAVWEGLTSGEARQTEAAQEAICGFKFKDLTLKRRNLETAGHSCATDSRS